MRRAFLFARLKITKSKAFDLFDALASRLLNIHDLLLDIIIMFPFRIPIPQFLASFAYGLLVKCYIVPPSTEPHRRIYIRVNFLSAPFIAVLFLLAVQAIDGMVVKKGILGADGVQPINIMALFISLVCRTRLPGAR